jgi:parvulin-like peptidyl-prolyl isomerase
VGEVSDVVQADGAYHLIKLEQLIEPKVVKFEEVKDAVRADLQRRLLEIAVRNLRHELAQEALTKLTILDPVLKKQFEDKLKEQQSRVQDSNEVREKLKKQDEEILAEQAKEKAAATTQSTQATTESATQPVPGPATDHSGSFIDGILPATMPPPMPSVIPGDGRPTTLPAATSKPATAAVHQ